MILLMTDETWERVRAALPADLLSEFEPIELPSDRELLRMARRGQTPAGVERIRARRNAGIAAATQTRADFNDLIRHVHGAGIPIATIARWLGVDRRSVYNAIESELTEAATT